LYSDHFPLLF